MTFSLVALPSELLTIIASLLNPTSVARLFLLSGSSALWHRIALNGGISKLVFREKKDFVTISRVGVCVVPVPGLTSLILDFSDVSAWLPASRHWTSGLPATMREIRIKLPFGAFDFFLRPIDASKDDLRTQATSFHCGFGNLDAVTCESVQERWPELRILHLESDQRLPKYDPVIPRLIYDRFVYNLPSSLTDLKLHLESALSLPLPHVLSHLERLDYNVKPRNFDDTVAPFTDFEQGHHHKISLLSPHDISDLRIPSLPEDFSSMYSGLCRLSIPFGKNASLWFLQYCHSLESIATIYLTSDVVLPPSVTHVSAWVSRGMALALLSLLPRLLSLLLAYKTLSPKIDVDLDAIPTGVQSLVIDGYYDSHISLMNSFPRSLTSLHLTKTANLPMSSLQVAGLSSLRSLCCPYCKLSDLSQLPRTMTHLDTTITVFEPEFYKLSQGLLEWTPESLKRRIIEIYIPHLPNLDLPGPLLLPQENLPPALTRLSVPYFTISDLRPATSIIELDFDQLEVVAEQQSARGHQRVYLLRAIKDATLPPSVTKLRSQYLPAGQSAVWPESAAGKHKDDYLEWPCLRTAVMLHTLHLTSVPVEHAPCVAQLPSTITDLQLIFQEVFQSGAPKLKLPPNWLPLLRRLVLVHVELKLKNIDHRLQPLEYFECDRLAVKGRNLPAFPPSITSLDAQSLRRHLAALLPAHLRSSMCTFAVDWDEIALQQLPANTECVSFWCPPDDASYGIVVHNYVSLLDPTMLPPFIHSMSLSGSGWGHHVATLVNLTSLNCDPYPLEVDCLSDLPSLKKLSITLSRLTPQVVERLPMMLEWLSILNCEVDADARDFPPSLTTLIVDDIAHPLTTLPQTLRSIYLRRSYITYQTPLPAWLSTCFFGNSEVWLLNSSLSA